MKNCNQIINGFAENIEQHSLLIHNFFNENRELFLKDEQLRDEFLKRQEENHETISKLVKSIEDEFIGKFIMIDNSHNFPNNYRYNSFMFNKADIRIGQWHRRDSNNRHPSIIDIKSYSRTKNFKK